MDKETKKLFEQMKNSNGWIPVSDLVKRFVEIDEYYEYSPWDINQILRNIHMIIPLEIPEECIDLLTNPMWREDIEDKQS